MIRGVDASLISSGMYQGGCPEVHEGTTTIKDAGFDVLVLLAEEYQPDPSRFPGVTVVHAPFQDGPLDQPFRRHPMAVAGHVVNYIEAGKSVLVTCYEGRNRSGLVCAFALRRMGVPAADAIAKVRNGRGARALSNPYFVKAITES